MVPELRVEPDGGDDLAGHGRGVAHLEAGGQVFGEGGVIERASGEPFLQTAERTLVGAPGVRADRGADPVLEESHPQREARARGAIPTGRDGRVGAAMFATIPLSITGNSGSFAEQERKRAWERASQPRPPLRLPSHDRPERRGPERGGPERTPAPAVPGVILVAWP